MKACNSCGVRKSLVDFAPDKQNRDRRKGKCRDSVLARQRVLRAERPERDRAWVAANHERVLDSKRAYRERNASKLRLQSRERARQRCSTAEGQEAARQIARRYAKRHTDELRLRRKKQRLRVPEKFRAREALNKAIKRGRVRKPACCTSCFAARSGLHGHHVDYRKPLQVVWLCARCHKQLHVGRAA